MDSFDPEKLSDDDIDETITKLMSRYNYALRGMNNSYLASQIETMIDQLYFEKDVRTKKSLYKESRSPVVIETEPDLRIKTETIDNSPNKRKISRGENPFSSGVTIIKRPPKNIKS